MYEVTKTNITPDNFFAGSFPVVTDFGSIKTGAKIRARVPVVQGADGIEEASADTLDKLIGISTSEPNGDEVVYYQTGEFFMQALTLPTGVTEEALKPALRKLNIFLREMNVNA